MAGQYDQCFFMPSHRIDQGQINELLQALESLPMGLPMESDQSEGCAKTVVTFMLHYHVEGDQTLAMCGSIPELGKWQFQGCLRAQRAPAAGSDWWFCQLKIPVSSTFVWRWVVLGPDGHPARWEERAERHTGVFYKPAVFHCAWNADEKSKLNEDLKALQNS